MNEEKEIRDRLARAEDMLDYLKKVGLRNHHWWNHHNAWHGVKESMAYYQGEIEALEWVLIEKPLGYDKWKKNLEEKWEKVEGQEV